MLPLAAFARPFVFITLQIPLTDYPSFSPFIFMNLQTPFPANPFFPDLYKTLGGVTQTKLPVDRFGTAIRASPMQKEKKRPGV